ncbi:MAG: hypothetical protein JSV36_18210, partial [Anaerolineae bacterium]
TAMHFRGLDETGLRSELWWESPDGSRVLLRHLPTYAGYTSAAVLSSDLQAAVGDLTSLAREEARRATTDVLLAMNGVDHMEAREDLPTLLRAATTQVQGVTFVQASLEEYFSALKAAVDGEALQVVRGELRDANRTPNRQVMRVLPNILSSRIYNKMQNERAQTLLERWAEPWSALIWTQGEAYPAALLWKAWEWLLKNHAHDSIGGCSVDAVHAQMETRFAWATEIAELLTAERFHLLASQLDLSALTEDEVALVLFNGLAWDWDGVVTVVLDLPVNFLNRWAVAHAPQPPEEITADTDYVEIYRWRPHLEWGGGQPILPDPSFRGLHLRSLADGVEVPLQIESLARTVVSRPLAGGLALSEVVQAQISFHARVPAYGYATYGARPDPRPNKSEAAAHPHNVLENEHLRTEIALNGTLTLTDKATGQVYEGLGYLEDGGDCGDGYNYSYPAQDRVYNTLGLAPRIMRLAEGPAIQRCRIDYDWPLPVGLDDARRRRREETVNCPLSVVVSLAQGSRRLDLAITFDNRARDHRLRVLFPSDVPVEASYSEAQFDVVQHAIRPEPVPAEAWVEDAPVTHPQQSWADVADGWHGLCIINQGLPEYEVLDTPRREVAVTLLRAVGYLGAGQEMQTAWRGAGPRVPTPEAQIQRQLTFCLALLPHAGTWEQAEVWRPAHAHNAPPRAITLERTPWQGGTRPAQGSLLRVEGRNAVLSAVKRAEREEALILRLYNPSSEATQAQVTLPFRPSDVWRVGLDEETPDQPERLAVEPDGHLCVGLEPKQIVTLRVECGRAGEAGLSSYGQEWRIV